MNNICPVVLDILQILLLVAEVVTDRGFIGKSVGRELYGEKDVSPGCLVHLQSLGGEVCWRPALVVGDVENEDLVHHWHRHDQEQGT